MWTKAQTWVTRFYIFCKFQQFSFVVPIIFRQLKCVDSDLQNWWTVEVSNLAATWSRPNLTQSQQVEEMVLKRVTTKVWISKHQDLWFLRLYCTTSGVTSVLFHVTPFNEDGCVETISSRQKTLIQVTILTTITPNHRQVQEG